MFELGAVLLSHHRLEVPSSAAVWWRDPNVPLRRREILQGYHEVKITLRVPHAGQLGADGQAAAGIPGCSSRSSSSGSASSLPETAVGMNGIELREQSHEEALLSTIGKLSSLLPLPGNAICEE